ncbi:hypothetical protein AOLI_G00201220 [Acnodon oligacanthus]
MPAYATRALHMAALVSCLPLLFNKSCRARAKRGPEPCGAAGPLGPNRRMEDGGVQEGCGLGPARPSASLWGPRPGGSPLFAPLTLPLMLKAVRGKIGASAGLHRPT